MGISSLAEQFLTIWVQTLPSRFSIPNTGVLFAAPLPLFPLTLLAPFCSTSLRLQLFKTQLQAKRSKSNFCLSQSEASRRACDLEILPLNLLIFSHSLEIRILISLKILHRVTSEILVKFDIFDASISSVKYLRISLNFFSEILERIIYLFFNFATLVTF